jgi:hypothetical protein
MKKGGPLRQLQTPFAQARCRRGSGRNREMEKGRLILAALLTM